MFCNLSSLCNVFCFVAGVIIVSACLLVFILVYDSASSIIMWCKNHLRGSAVQRRSVVLCHDNMLTHQLSVRPVY